MMLRRFYHVSGVCYSIKKQGLKLNKMLNPKSKRQWYPSQMFDADLLPSVKSLTKTQNVPGKQGTRRVAMLNKMFMKHITDLMSTGTIAMNVVGRGIEISKVKVSPDMQTVNVFWVCKGNASDVETEALLNKTAGPLRHELSTLRVMGEVPYIVFVKDRHEANIVELDRRLAVADYGADYTPTEIGHLMKTEFTLDTKLSPEMKAKIKQLEDTTVFEEDPIPEMTNNVFGLDHEKIMKRLLAARKRSKDAWSSLNEATPLVSYRADGSKPSEVNVGKQKQELADFLMKRQILQNKLDKELRDARKEWTSYHEEDENTREENYDDPQYEERLLEEHFAEEYYKDIDKFDSKR